MTIILVSYLNIYYVYYKSVSWIIINIQTNI